MSTSLFWKPVKDYSGTLPDGLKYALRKMDEWHNGGPQTLTKSDIPFLRGLSIGDVDGADKLIYLIEKHGEIEVEEKA
jgi:hypothetical protein